MKRYLPILLMLCASCGETPYLGPKRDWAFENQYKLWKADMIEQNRIDSAHALLVIRGN